jgi:hypothetical protein
VKRDRSRVARCGNAAGVTAEDCASFDPADLTESDGRGATKDFILSGSVSF